MSRHLTVVSKPDVVRGASMARTLPSSASAVTGSEWLTWAETVAFVGWFFSKFSLHLG